MGPLIPWVRAEDWNQPHDLPCILTSTKGTGLGEAKFQVNLTRFNGVWGRPQRDGPALRAITLMVYINYLLEHGQYEHAKTVIWPIVSNDLSYVGQYWNETGYGRVVPVISIPGDLNGV